MIANGKDRANALFEFSSRTYLQVSVIKAHPQHFSPQQLFTLPETNTSLSK